VGVRRGSRSRGSGLLLVVGALITALVGLTSSLAGVTSGRPQLVLIVANAVLLLATTLLARKTRREVRRRGEAERHKAAAERHKAEAERLRAEADQLRRDAEERRVLAEQSEEKARADMRVRLAESLAPLIWHMGNIATERDPGKQAELCRATAVRVVNAAVVLGPQRVRACWYDLQVGSRKTLVRMEQAGRTSRLPACFEAGTTAGDVLIQLICQDDEKLIPDTLIEPLPGWQQLDQDDFRTFMVAPVIAGRLAFGMLTVDAPEPGDLTKEDLDLLRLLAGILATSLAQDAKQMSKGALAI
jgi:hypothetical protein